ncbi:MAG: TonB family protein [candidate division KSB1 bacterium]
MKTQARMIEDFFPYGAPEMLLQYNKYLAWATLIAVALQLFGLLSWVAARALSEEPEAPMVRMRIIKDVAELGPPPSISATTTPAIAVSGPAVRPSVGIPVPVPDAQITEENTIATQEELAQMQAPISSGAGGGTGDSLVISDDAFLFEEEPDIDEFIPYQVAPVIIKRVEPIYPELARKAGMQGKVWVKVLIDKEGKVKKAVIMQGIEIFHEAAISSVLQWVFKPAIQQDRPIAVWMAIPINFKLLEQ